MWDVHNGLFYSGLDRLQFVTNVKLQPFLCFGKCFRLQVIFSLILCSVVHEMIEHFMNAIKFSFYDLIKSIYEKV